MNNERVKSVGGGIIGHSFESINYKSPPEAKIFGKIISLENLFTAWREFSRGKKNKSDVQRFKFNVEENLFQLHRELENKTYRHSNYSVFNVCDPKFRQIHKACVCDRVLHHAIFRVLYQIFDKSFIFDSYSCRLGKGTHRAVKRVEKLCRQLSCNNNKNIFVLKCDVRKFFNSIDQEILLNLISRKIKDENVIWLLCVVIKSFPKSAGKGLPLGNVTSQLFANIYLNELDQFVKYKLKARYYLRYCDDFIILNRRKEHLESLVEIISGFLASRLKLALHSDKIILKKYHQGIDFLGYVVFPQCRVLRTKTKRRIFRRVKENCQSLQEGLILKDHFEQSLQSYLGVLKHCRGYKKRKIIESLCV